MVWLTCAADSIRVSGKTGKEIIRRPLIISAQNPLKLGIRCLRTFSSTAALFRPPTAPQAYKPRELRFRFFIPAIITSQMPSTVFSRRHFSPDRMMTGFDSDASMKDATALLNFDDGSHFVPPDPDPMIFGPLDFEEVPYRESPTVPFPWDPFGEVDSDIKPTFNFSGPSSGSTNYEFGPSHASPADNYYNSGGLYSPEELNSSPGFGNNLYLDNWVNDPDMSPIPSPSSPIPIPSNATSPQSPSFVAYVEHPHFLHDSSFSPAGFAALHPLPASVSPSTSFEDQNPVQRQRIDSISPQEMSLHPPSWASQLWEAPSSLRTPSSSRSSVRHSPLTDHTGRQRIPTRRDSLSPGQIFQSSSAPSLIQTRTPSVARSYSRRAESVCVSDDHDRDATVRRRKRSAVTEDLQTTDKANEGREYNAQFSFFRRSDMCVS